MLNDCYESSNNVCLCLKLLKFFEDLVKILNERTNTTTFQLQPIDGAHGLFTAKQQFNIRIS